MKVLWTIECKSAYYKFMRGILINDTIHRQVSRDGINWETLSPSPLYPESLIFENYMISEEIL
jgi:hypothetical protein